jgi:hypothetical protein
VYLGGRIFAVGREFAVFAQVFLITMRSGVMRILVRLQHTLFSCRMAKLLTPLLLALVVSSTVEAQQGTSIWVCMLAQISFPTVVCCLLIFLVPAVRFLLMLLSPPVQGSG